MYLQYVDGPNLSSDPRLTMCDVDNDNKLM